MATTSSALTVRDLAFTHAPARGKLAVRAKLPERVKRGLFSRLLDAMMLARRRQAERDIARYLVDSGGKFTDETEREIERRFLSNTSRW